MYVYLKNTDGLYTLYTQKQICYIIPFR